MGPFISYNTVHMTTFTYSCTQNFFLLESLCFNNHVRKNVFKWTKHKEYIISVLFKLCFTLKYMCNYVYIYIHIYIYILGGMIKLSS